MRVIEYNERKSTPRKIRMPRNLIRKIPYHTSLGINSLLAVISSLLTQVACNKEEKKKGRENRNKRERREEGKEV